MYKTQQQSDRIHHPSSRNAQIITAFEIIRQTKNPPKKTKNPSKAQRGLHSPQRAMTAQVPPASMPAAGRHDQERSSQCRVCVYHQIACRPRRRKSMLKQARKIGTLQHREPKGPAQRPGRASPAAADGAPLCVCVRHEAIRGRHAKPRLAAANE